VIFFRKNQESEDDEEEVEYVLFQGATNGREANLDENKKLVAAGLTAAKELVTDTISARGEVLKVEPQGPGAVATIYVDGLRRPGGKFPIQRANAITQMLKLLAGMDITVRDKPQRGGIKAKYKDLPFELTIKTQPGKGGELLTMTVRNTKTRRVTPEDISMPELVKEKIRATAAGKTGIVLIVGAPESGVTTTALCSLRCIDSYLYQCYIIGDIGNREVLNVPVFKQEEGHTLDFTLERIKRNEGDVVFFSDFTDPETVRSAVMFSDKVCIVSEMYAKDAADGVMKLIELAGDRALVAENLRCVVSHRLIRKLCPKCREAFRPNPKLLAQVGLPEETQTLYRTPAPPEPDPKTGELPEPCRACDGAGFRARAAVFEMLEGTEGIREVILSGGDAAALRAKARQEKQLTCQQDALRLVADGTTGLEELKRVFAPPGGGPQRKKKPVRKRPAE